MARGWESKSVEAQQSEASEPRVTFSPPLTQEQKANLRKKQGLLLDRQRVLSQLQTAGNPRYRNMLQAALAELDGRIADLS